jgi:RNA 3'-terminal phosphate cyclase (ATP)
LAAIDLAVLRASAAVCDGRLGGDTPGATAVRFEPGGPAVAGEYAFDIATLSGSRQSGAATLVLDVLLLPLATQGRGPSTLTLTGGTHLPSSPHYHYLADVTLPLLERIGVRCTVELGKWGWQSGGGGLIEARIEPVPTGASLQALDLAERGTLRSVWGLSAASNLPRHIIRRQRERLEARLWSRHQRAEVLEIDAPSGGVGTVAFLVAEYEGVAAGFTAFGRLRYPAESVADDAFDAFDAHRTSRRALDPYLADQVLLPLALAPGSSRLSVAQVTPTLLSTAAWLGRHVDRAVRVIGSPGEPGLVTVD